MELRGELTHALESLLALEPTSNPSTYEVLSTASNICARAQRQHPEMQIFEQICELLVEASEISRDATRSHEINQLTRAPIDLLKQILQPDESDTKSQGSSQHLSATPEQSLWVSYENGSFLFQVIVDRSSEYDLKKIIAQELSLRELGQKMRGEWAVIGLYGEYQNCLRVARHLLEIPDLDLPSASEGIAGLYSEPKRTLILAVIDRDLMYFNQRPYDSKNISTQLIGYLLDVASTIIVCPSDKQLRNWYFTTNKTLANPYVPRVHTHAKKRFIQRDTEPLTPSPIAVISQQDAFLVLNGDGMDSTFSFKHYLFSTDNEKVNVVKHKETFMSFVKRNINDLHRGVEEVMRTFDEQFIELWRSMKHNCKNRNLPLDHIKQTLTTDLKKQYSRKKGILESDNRVRLMSEELDSVIAKLLDTSIEIRIEKVKFEFQTSEGATTLNLIDSPQNTFVGILSIPKIDNLQILTLSPEIVVALFQYQDQTMYFTINSEYGRRFNKAKPNSVPYSLMVVPGSTAQNFFSYSNTRKRARYGSLGDAHGLEGGNNHDSVFSGETEGIIAGFYLKTKRQLVYINQSGTVFSINFNDAYRTPTKVLDSNYSPLRSFDKFLDVRVPDNEQVYVFRTDFAFVIYKADFSFFRQIICNAHQYKVINDSLNCIYLISLGETLQGWKFAVGGISMQFDDLSAPREVTFGNPIVDVLQCAIGKFGICDETEETRELLILSDLKTQAEVLKYTKALPHCRQHFQTIKTLDFQEFTSYSLSRNIEGPAAFQLLASRVPLHIASIMGQSLMPLKNGEIVNSTSKSDEVDLSAHLLKMIEFGLYETELLKAKKLKVVSIIGRRSSGKSYLLNRLFGTRFNVATERCTDGLWMSMAVLEGQTFVVLDCEGLLSSVRSTQDEMRMCLALAAVSDVLMFNTDISGINKQSQKLFESMNSACGKLKGEELFKGKLWITIRDVSDTQYEGIISEIETRIESLRADNKFKFIMELFGGNCDTVCIHCFNQIDAFASDLEQIIVELLKLPVRWQEGSTFLERFKMTLVQIRIQDERMLPIKTNKAKKVVESINSNPNSALLHLGDLAFTHNFLVGQTPFTLTLTEYIDASGLYNFVSRFLAATSIELMTLHHNEWHTELDRFIKAYFEKRKELALQFIDKLFGSIQGEVEKQILYASNHLDLNAGKASLCLKSCRECSYVCVDLDYHDSEHSCKTDHKCTQRCVLCPDNKCSKQAGHLDYHYCDILKHMCKSKCSVPICKKNCSLNYKHDKTTQCNCRQNHKCPEKCSLQVCYKKCNETLETPHTKHHCGEVCPYKCIFDDGNTCSSKDHFHHITAEQISHDCGLKKPHICNKKHECKRFCTKPGFCITDITDPVKRVYSERPRESTHTSFESNEKISMCNVLIPEGELEHEGPHTCNKAFHGCDSKCPCCNVYCTIAQYGHPGLHDNSTHMNKVNMIYSSISAKEFTIGIEGTEMSFIPGNSCRAETCDASCRRRKGCVVKEICMGGDECLQVKYPNLAYHNPEISFPDKVINDEIRCDKYYELRQWKSPLETIDPNLFREHIRCRCSCCHSSHLGSDSNRCSELLYHTYSEEYSAHRFACRH
jgi:hypothetical protein